MSGKKLLAVFAACLVLAAGLYTAYWMLEDRKQEEVEEGDTPPNGENNGEEEISDGGMIEYNPALDWTPKPATGVRRNPGLPDVVGSIPSPRTPWPMYQQNPYHTGFVASVGQGDISNYGLLYHAWTEVFRPVVADFTGDGKNEILSYPIFAGIELQFPGRWYYGDVQLHNHQGRVIWQVPIDDEINASPALADMNGDGETDIVIALRTEAKIIVLDKDGSMIMEYQGEQGHNIETDSVLVADITGDGNMEILYGTSDYVQAGETYLYCLTVKNGELNLLWQYTVAREEGLSIIGSPALADITGDGRYDVVFGSRAEVHAVDADGQEIWRYLNEDAGQYPRHDRAATIADLDGDGNIEIIMPWSEDESLGGGRYRSANTGVVCLDRHGNKIWFVIGKGHPWAMRSASVADLTGDGWLEVVYGFGKTLIALNARGEPLWELECEGRLGEATIADLDGSGKPEIITSTSGIFSPPPGNYSLLIISSSGTILFKHRGCTPAYPPAIVDLNGNGKLEIVIGGSVKRTTEDERIYAPEGLYVFGDMSSTDLIDTMPDVGTRPYLVQFEKRESPGGEDTFTVTVSNPSLVEVYNVEVLLSTDAGVEIGMKTISHIPPLEDRDIVVTTRSTFHKLIVHVAPYDKIEESNTLNNRIEYIPYRGPDPT